jgi:hypothetical protein
MKNSLLLLFAFFSPALFAQVMTVTVDQDDFLVCPDEVVEVVAARSTTANNSLQFDGASDYLEIPNNACYLRILEGCFIHTLAPSAPI